MVIRQLMKKVIYLLLIILFLSKTQNIFASENTFTVDNIEVTGKISNNNYRDKYLGIAFNKGFQILIQKILKTQDQKKLLSTDIKTIKSLIENYRIIEENALVDNYTLKAEVTFNRNRVNKLLYLNNISYSEVTKLDMLVYPIMIYDSKLNIFSNNKFMEDWNDNEDFEGINFILPIENVEDINYIKNNLPILEEIDLSRLVDNYEIKNSTILILRYDNKDLNVFLKTNFRGKKKVKRVNLQVQDLAKKEVRENIIINLKSNINDMWKEQNFVDISTPSYLTVNARLKEPGSLINIIEKIKEISLIDYYFVEELDKNSAKIKIKYFGKIKNLQNSFQDNGFEFKVIHNEWSLNLIS